MTDTLDRPVPSLRGGASATSLGKTLLEGADEVAIRAVQRVGARETYLPGDVIFAEGEEGDALWIVESGTVEIFKVIRGDVDRVLGTCVAGDVFGDMSFLDGSRRSASARATEASHLLKLSRADFDRVAQDHVRLGATFFTSLAVVLAERLRLTNEAFKQSVVQHMEATGAAPLNLHRYAEELRLVTVHLTAGAPLKGNLLALEHQPPGWAIMVKDERGRVSLVPYHAVVRIEVE